VQILYLDFPECLNDQAVDRRERLVQQGFKLQHDPLLKIFKDLELIFKRIYLRTLKVVNSKGKVRIFLYSTYSLDFSRFHICSNSVVRKLSERYYPIFFENNFYALNFC
jgi:hypothetical protein